MLNLSITYLSTIVKIKKNLGFTDVKMSASYNIYMLVMMKSADRVNIKQIC